MKLVTGLIRLFLILIDAILFFLFLLFFFWFFAKIKIPNQKKIYQIKINTWILRSKLNSLCANKKPNIEYRKPNSEFRIPNTVTAHTTTKYYNDNTATRHTPTPHSCFVYQQTINNKQKHCIIYRNTRKKKKKPHTITMTKMMFQAKWTRRRRSCTPSPRWRCCWMPPNHSAVVPPPRRPITSRSISRRPRSPIVPMGTSTPPSTR